MKNILVTGGCGFVGANLIPKLLDRGYKIRVLDDLSKGHAEYLDGLDLEMVKGDILDAALAEQVYQGIDAVIHLAAYGSVVESVNDPVPNFEINARGTFEVLNNSRLAGVEKLIFASTGGAIIGNAEPPVDETTLPKPISPYGASKLCGEAYCHAFAKSYGLKTVALRFANIYGPYSQHKRGAVTLFIRAIRNGTPITVFGDGSASRDFIYVDDLCNGIVNALERDLPSGSAYHLASEKETTVKELAEELIAVSGKTTHELLFEPARRGEVERNFATADKAKAELGFSAEVGLREGMQKTWDWFVENE